MDLVSMIKSGLMDNWGTIAVFILPFLMPNAWLEKIGYGIGKFFTTVLRQKAGKQGEQVEKWFQLTLSSFINGLNRGLDSDDKEDGR